MKKSFFYLSVVVLALMFTACDSGVTKQSLLGKWEVSHITFNYWLDGELLGDEDTDFTEKSVEEKVFIEFLENDSLGGTLAGSVYQLNPAGTQIEISDATGKEVYDIAKVASTEIKLSSVEEKETADGKAQKIEVAMSLVKK